MMSVCRFVCSTDLVKQILTKAITEVKVTQIVDDQFKGQNKQI